MQSTAKLRAVRISAQKTRLVADQKFWPLAIKKQRVLF